MKNILLSICILFSVSSPGQTNHQPRFTRLDDGKDVTHLLPGFYLLQPKPHRDTTWKFECYGAKDDIMNIDTVRDINNVKYFSLFKSYTDSGHTYKDNNGKKQFLPVSVIVQRYDKTAKDKWLHIDYSTNKYVELREFQQEIVRSDTVIIMDPISGKEQSRFYKYYKIAPAK